ncbi:MAG: ABC transporter substrate-binding protein [Thermodesulfobacteriota bacterium]
MIPIFHKAASIRPILVFLLLFLIPTEKLSAESGRPVTVAAILPQSGKAEAYGKAALQGARIAVEEINREGGLRGRPLVLIVLDSRSSPLHGKKMAEEAIQQDVTAVVGDLWSTHSLAIAPLLQQAGIPMITPGSTAPEVTRVGNYIFRSCYTDDFQGKLMADFAFRDIGVRTAAILTNISETYSQILAQYFAEAFIRQGGRILFQGGYKGSAVDFRELLAPVTESAPDVVFVPGYSRDSGLIIKQARAMGIHSVFMGGDAWEPEIQEYAGEALEGSFYSTHWHPDLPSQHSKAFIGAYRKACGSGEISSFAPLSYDAVRLLADAVRRSASPDRADIRNGLAATSGYAGVTGLFRFDADRNPIHKNAGILRFHQGNWQFHKAYSP